MTFNELDVNAIPITATLHPIDYEGEADVLNQLQSSPAIRHNTLLMLKQIDSVDAPSLIMSAIVTGLRLGWYMRDDVAQIADTTKLFGTTEADIRASIKDTQ